MKKQADRHWRDLTFSVGDWVLLRLQPYRQFSVQRCPSQKLSHRFYGPFRIICCLGSITFELALPPESRIHPVFHASLLKPFYGDPLTAISIPLPAPPEVPPLLSPHRILGHRTIRTSSSLESQLLIHWEGQDEAESTWVSSDSFLSSFPHFDLEAKVFLDGPGIVRNKTNVGLELTEKGLEETTPNEAPNGLKITNGPPGPSLRRSTRSLNKPSWLKDFY
ncbi:UNVERIFIED_CONTAM: hypothetical protein Sradi_1571000 [Sesamum radiatum]|uniref:Chromo domain-containing protein n=1 Tax=Sesamum radiatum TaxID=300843 RepID=A0AAW2UA56_SESRA